MLQEIDRIHCVECGCLLFIERFDTYLEDFDFEVFNNYIMYDYSLFCTNCVIHCKMCINYIEKDNYLDDCCESCYIKNMIKTTSNDITKKLPVELVECILKNV